MNIVTKRLVSKSKLPKDIIDLCKELKSLLKDSSNEGIHSEISNISLNLTKEYKYVFDAPKIYFSMVHKVLMAITSLVYGYVGLMGLSLLIFSEEFKPIGIVFVIFSLIFLYINYVLSKKNSVFIRELKTFRKYCDYLNYRYFVYIDELNKITGIGIDELLNNIEWAIYEGIISQGHIISNNRILIIADSFYEMLYGDCEEGAIDFFPIKKFKDDERQKVFDLQNEIEECFQKLNAIKVDDKKILSNIERVQSMVSIVISNIYYNDTVYMKLGSLLISFIDDNISIVSRFKDTKSHFFKQDSRALLADDQRMLIDIYDDILRRAYKEIDSGYLNKLKTKKTGKSTK